MKNLKFLFVLMFAVLATSFVALAQGTDPMTGTEMFGAFFTSLAVMAAIVAPVTGWVSTHVTGGKGIQVLSWVIAIALAYLAWFMKWGMFGELSPVWAGLYGLGAGFISNGIADIKWVQALLEAIAARSTK